MSKLVPLPTDSLVPERDAGKMPILEARHLGIEFGGLKASTTSTSPSAGLK